MSGRAGASFAAFLAAVLAPPLWAQGVQTCTVVVDSTGGSGRQVDIGGGKFRIYAGGGVRAHCKGQSTRMASDSVAYDPNFNRWDMIGHVMFQDSTTHLTADRSSYFLGDERLEAYGNARLENLATHSILTGPELTYRRAVAGVRDSADLTACQRPTIHYQATPDSAGAEPYVIVADCVHMAGGARAWAGGHVTIDRSDFKGRADSATLDTDGGRGRLIGHATVSGDSAAYTLDGRTIDYRLKDRQLTWVQANGGALATSVDWHLAADTIQLDIDSDQVQSGAAWGDSTRPRAVSARQTILADSLAILSPGQLLKAVRGIGTAQATSQQDSTDTDADWMAGDTVVAQFGAAADGHRSLDRLVATGNARARYRVFAEGEVPGPGVKPAGINYSRGVRIVARFLGDQVKTVDVAGKADGVYLERQPAKAAPKDSTAADSSAAKPKRGGGG